MLDAVAAQGLEGIVAKRLDSRYEPGRRSRAWIKTPVRHTALVTPVGWTASAASRERLAALLLAIPDRTGALVYAGDVGTGWSTDEQLELRDLLIARERADPPVSLPHGRSPRWRRGGRATVRWAEPGLIGEIAYRQITRENASFRHPSWQRLRPDLT